MKKLSTILLMFSALSLFAQSPAVSVPQKTKKMSIHFEAGVNNFHHYGHSLMDRYDVSSSHFESFTIEKELSQYISISLGARNVNYGLKESNIPIFDINGNEIANNVVVYHNHWTIQTPLQMIVKPFKSKNFSINFGGYLGYNYYNSTSSSNPNFKINEDNSKYLLDLGMNFGVGYDWFKKGNFTIGNTISYYIGFSDLNPMQPFLVAFGIPHIPIKSNGLTIGFVGKFGF